MKLSKFAKGAVFILLFFVTVLSFNVNKAESQTLSIEEIRERAIELAIKVGDLSYAMRGGVLGEQTATSLTPDLQQQEEDKEAKRPRGEREKEWEIDFEISTSHPCPWDLNQDGVVNSGDIMILLAAWGPNPGHPADFNKDGVVNGEDLRIIVNNLGECSSESQDLSYSDSISQHGVTWYFEDHHLYGQFANGDYWVQGPVNIRDVTPEFIYEFHYEEGEFCQSSSDCTNHKNEMYQPSCVSNPNGEENICKYERAFNGMEKSPFIYEDSSMYRGQGYDARRHFDSSLIPSIPYLAEPGEKIIKGVSYDYDEHETPMNTSDSCDSLSGWYGNSQCVENFSILTIVDQVPPGYGKDVFRPQYTTNEDTGYFYVEDINWETLPLGKYALPDVPSGEYRSFEESLNRLSAFRPDHYFYTITIARSRTAGSGSGAGYANQVSDSALATLVDFPDISDEQRQELAIHIIQRGLDVYDVMSNADQGWPAAGGHGHGRLVPAWFAATMLENQEMIEFLNNLEYNRFGETSALLFREEANLGEGRVLYGETLFGQEENYWSGLVSGNAVRRDPYGFIDGGRAPASAPYYQHCCTSGNWWGSSVVFELVSAMKSNWDQVIDHSVHGPQNLAENFFSYVDRWTPRKEAGEEGFKGAWTSPDACAPAEGVCEGGGNDGQVCTTQGRISQSIHEHCPGGSCVLNVDSSDPDSNYGVTFGPDPDNSGMCILDPNLEYFNSIKDFACKEGEVCGRFPQKHGKLTTHGVSPLQMDIWELYIQ